MLLKLVGQSLRQPNPLRIRQPSRRQMLIAKHLTQFFVVCPQMSSIGFLISPSLRKHGKFWIPLMTVQRKLRIQSYRW